MAVTLNASASAGFVTTADTSTILQLQTAGTTAISISSGQVATFAQAPVLPAASIPQAALAAGVAGNGPAFSVYLNGNQAISAGSTTKIQFNTEVFDTNNNFDSTTNYRFTPTVAGYYQVNGHMQFLITSGIVIGILYKNGSNYKFGTYIELASTNPHSHVSDVVYLNGSTDYIEMYGYSSVAGNFNGSVNPSVTTYFSAAMVRSA